MYMCIYIYIHVEREIYIHVYVCPETEVDYLRVDIFPNGEDPVVKFIIDTNSYYH